MRFLFRVFSPALSARNPLRCQLYNSQILSVQQHILEIIYIHCNQRYHRRHQYIVGRKIVDWFAAGCHTVVVVVHAAAGFVSDFYGNWRPVTAGGLTRGESLCQAMSGSGNLSARAVDNADHEMPSPLYQRPRGVAMLDDERAIVTAGDGRVSLPHDALTRAFVAYCGNYTFDGRSMWPASMAHRDRTWWRTRVVTFVLMVRHAWSSLHKSRLFGLAAGLEMTGEQVG